MSPTVIRRLVPAELVAYKRLRDQCLDDHPDAFTSDASEARGRDAASYLDRLGIGRPEEGHFTLGAWRGETLAGAVSCERERRITA